MYINIAIQKYMLSKDRSYADVNQDRSIALKVNASVSRKKSQEFCRHSTAENQNYS